MPKTVYLYILDTMSDWEIGYLTAELNSSRFFKPNTEKLVVKTVANSLQPIITMGGMRIVPDLTVGDLKKEEARLLILPGADTWLEEINTPILEIAKECLSSGVVVSAICGATMGLAKADVLNNRKHTSNDLEFLKSVCPNYTGEKLYSNTPAVSDGNLITASGTAPLQLAYETIKLLDVFSAETLEAWYNLHLTHKEQYFYALMKSLGQ